MARGKISLDIRYGPNDAECPSGGKERPYVVVQITNSTEVTPGTWVTKAWLDARIHEGWTVRINRKDT